MLTAYAILYIDKATRAVVRAQTASDFPVCGEFRYAQVVLLQRDGATLDAAIKSVRLAVRDGHGWAVPLFRRGEI